MRFTVIVLFLLTATLVWGQVDTGAISGTVKDSTGAIVQDAVVKVEDTATGSTVSIHSNAVGFFSAPGLKPGTYQVSAAAAGFQTVVKTGIEVRVQDRLNIDFDLQPGQISTEVTVAAQAPALESGTSSLGQVVEETEIKNLPLNGRNYIQLATLKAGTSPSRHWFDASAFATPAAFVYGNAGRNILSGPGQRNIDIGLSRTISIRERIGVEFRAEAFNLFNTPQFGLPNATLGVATTGVISTVVNPQRELELALRLAF